MTQPTILGYFYLFVSAWVNLQATDPPIEWPMMTTFFSGKRSMICLRTSIDSATKVYIEKSCKFYFFFEYPWPLKSKLTRVPKFFTYLANAAKLNAEWPAPWMQKNKAPYVPALNIEVPWIYDYKYVIKIWEIVKEEVPVHWFVIFFWSLLISDVMERLWRFSKWWWHFGHTE